VAPDSSPLFLGFCFTRTIPVVLAWYMMESPNLAGACASLPNQPDKVHFIVCLVCVHCVLNDCIVTGGVYIHVLRVVIFNGEG